MDIDQHGGNKANTDYSGVLYPKPTAYMTAILDLTALPVDNPLPQTLIVCILLNCPECGMPDHPREMSEMVAR